MHMYREIFEQPAVLQACMERKMPRPSGEIAAAGGRIRNIVIAARGSSDHAGTYGKYMLEILTGVPVSLAGLFRRDRLQDRNGLQRLSRCGAFAVGRGGGRRAGACPRAPAARSLWR